MPSPLLTMSPPLSLTEPPWTSRIITKEESQEKQSKESLSCDTAWFSPTQMLLARPSSLTLTPPPIERQAESPGVELSSWHLPLPHSSCSSPLGRHFPSSPHHPRTIVAFLSSSATLPRGHFPPHSSLQLCSQQKYNPQLAQEI